MASLKNNGPDFLPIFYGFSYITAEQIKADFDPTVTQIAAVGTTSQPHALKPLLELGFVEVFRDLPNPYHNNETTITLLVYEAPKK